MTTKSLYGNIITVEDHNVIGGLGSAVAEVIAEYGRSVIFKRLGLHCFSMGYGTYEEVKKNNCVNFDAIIESVSQVMS